VKIGDYKTMTRDDGLIFHAVCVKVHPAGKRFKIMATDGPDKGKILEIENVAEEVEPITQTIQ
jgi:hypothetical protein